MSYNNTANIQKLNAKSENNKKILHNLSQNFIKIKLKASMRFLKKFKLAELSRVV